VGGLGPDGGLKFLSAIIWVREKHAGWHERLWRLDLRVSGWPVIRGMGDHFLIVMKKK
jgi:hypothetical protein